MKICFNCFNDIPDSMKFCPHCGSSADLRNEDEFPYALPCGTILGGRYIIGRVLGQGIFGITYVGQDYRTKTLVAIKEYFPDTLASRYASYSVVPCNTDKGEDYEYGKKQFLEGARMLRMLTDLIGSPNIVRVHSYFWENGTAYFVMEYVLGKSLRQYVRSRGGRISWEEAWDLLMPVLEALSEVHSRCLLHRDINPDNIIITKSGCAKLIDFGSARYYHRKNNRVFFISGFNPLEQWIPRGREGPWTDVYALAATIYCCITGKEPASVDMRAGEDTLKKPSELGVSIPDYAETALMKALAVKEKDRYGSTYDFRNAVLEGKRREEEERGVKTTLPDQKDIIFRDTQKKAAAGDPDAQYLPGSFYESGEGVQQSDELAEKWYRLAAAQDNSAAEGQPQPYGNKAGSGSPKNIGSNTDSEGTHLRGSGTNGKSPESGTTDQGIIKSVPREKGDTGLSSRIILALGLIVLIAVVGFVIPNRNRSQSTVTDTGSSERINERVDESSGQDASSPQEEKEEKELVQTSRTSDVPMELTDTWEEIAAASRDGTYKERYRIGDTKELDMGSEGIITMKLVAMEEDELADGSEKAPMTWVADECLLSPHKIISGGTNESVWEASEMRTWLRETVLPLMPKEVRNNIREVTKYSYSYEKGKDVASEDTIWIPSVREVFPIGHDDLMDARSEKEGVSYTSVFTDNEVRKRSRDGESGASLWWWLRSASYSLDYCFGLVNSGGDIAYNINPFAEGGVVIGFCF